MTTEQDEILFDVRNGLGLITLNRPQALNALTLNMVRLMDQQLIDWAKDDSIRAVAVTGAGEKAFCAGGDVKAVAIEARATNGQGDLCRNFFREEYILNHRIHTFPKPYVALMRGIVMGGGKGISAHGSHRVVADDVVFAMPETNIGFFPDVGGGYFLPRCPGETGAYLALTSRRIGAADCAYIGFATHTVPTETLPQILESLVQEENVNEALAPFSRPPEAEPALLPILRPAIDRCFAHDSIEKIFEVLEGEESEWGRETLGILKTMSPTSLKVALRQIRLGAKMDFAAVMEMEYRLSQHLIAMHDSYEGIRAALIDKDRQPKWNPATVAEVDDAVVDACFESLGDQDLKLAA